MVKYSSYRTSKYSKKLTGEVPEGIQEQQKKGYKIAGNELARIEQVIKSLIAGRDLPYYIIFGKECVKRARTHKGTNLREEIRILENKWAGRGLDEELLNNIKIALNIPLPSPPLPSFFTLDVSVLDGPDVLA